MKKLLILAFLLANMVLFAQNGEKKIFLDSLNHNTTEGNHKYYRIIEIYGKFGVPFEYTDYYLNGQIKRKITSDYQRDNQKNDIEKVYDSFEKLKSDSKFKNSYILDGRILNSFYENGNKEIEGEFVKIKTDVGKEHVVLRVLSYWDENGNQKVIDGNGLMVENWEIIDESSKGKMENGFKTGIWTGFNSAYKIQFADQYDSGIFIAGVSKDVNNKEYKYLEFEKQPEFRNEGMTGFVKFVQKNYVTPDVENTVRGRVFVEFSVDADSKVSEVKLIRGLHKKVDREAVRLIHYSSGLWTPGEYRGVKTKIRFSLPIIIDIKVNKYGLN